MIIPAGFSDLDPHYAYDNLSSMLFLGTYEMLLQLKGSSTDEFEPMLAESWEASEDQSTYTFKLAPDATFHDGTPCDAEAVKASFTRFLLQGGRPGQRHQPLRPGPGADGGRRRDDDPLQPRPPPAPLPGGDGLRVRPLRRQHGGRRSEQDRGGPLRPRVAPGQHRRHRPVSRHGIRAERAGRPRAVRRLPRGLGRQPVRPDPDPHRPRERDPPPADRERRCRRPRPSP